MPLALLLIAHWPGTARRAAFLPNPGKALKPGIRPLIVCGDGEEKARRGGRAFRHTVL